MTGHIGGSFNDTIETIGVDQQRSQRSTGPRQECLKFFQKGLDFHPHNVMLHWHLLG
jgi:hypothetical protein